MLLALLAPWNCPREPGLEVLVGREVDHLDVDPVIEVEALLVGDPERPVADPRLRSIATSVTSPDSPPDVASVESSLPQAASRPAANRLSTPAPIALAAFTLTSMGFPFSLLGWSWSLLDRGRPRAGDRGLPALLEGLLAGRC
ncbi:MAG: hypothetical protein R2691_00205 [Solirubrobacterales bacterium]